MRPALETGNVTLMTGAIVRRLIPSSDAKLIEAVEIDRGGRVERISAKMIVVACGAINSAAAQLIGKVQGSMLKGSRPYLPACVAGWIASHTNEWWLLTEDLPDPDNRVTLGSDGSIHIHYTPNNRPALYQLAKNVKTALRKAGFPIVLIQYPEMEVTSHQAGTVRFGDDPKTSALNRWCRSHDVDNLYVVDASFFPSLPAMGPTLTIVAQGLRVGQHIAEGSYTGTHPPSS